MATQVIKTRTDDVTGEAHETVAPYAFSIPVFGEDNVIVTARVGLDASEATQERINAAIREAQEKYVRALSKSLGFVLKTEAVKVTIPKASVKSTGDKAKAKTENQVIREWAKAAGYSVGDRGRIPDEVMDAYGKREQATAEPETNDEAVTEAA